MQHTPVRAMLLKGAPLARLLQTASTCTAKLQSVLSYTVTPGLRSRLSGLAIAVRDP